MKEIIKQHLHTCAEQVLANSAYKKINKHNNVMRNGVVFHAWQMIDKLMEIRSLKSFTEGSLWIFQMGG